MAAKVRVLDPFGKSLPHVKRSVAALLVRRLLASEVHRGLIQMFPPKKPCLRAIDMMPQRSGPYIPSILPPSEINGCIFEDPQVRQGKAFWLLAARKLSEASL